MDKHRAPLAGVKIIDLTRLLPGPVATMHLADLGAEVIKVEDPGLGDYTRQMGARRVATTQMFLAVNRNKHFVEIDLRDDAGRAHLIELVRETDALIEGFRPGVMDKLGIGWEQLSAINPRLVMCSISGYGQTGPMRDYAGHDLNYISLTGMLEQTAGRDGYPAIPALQIADLLGGAQSAVIGLLAALLDARRTGIGRFVDVSMTDAVFAHNIVGLCNANIDGPQPLPGKDLLTGGVACYNIYRCGDARFVAVGALELKFWESLCDGLGRPELKTAHWAHGQQPGGAEALATRTALDEVFATRSQQQWVQHLAGRDCCVTPVLTTAEALEHPLFKARGMVVDVADPQEGHSRFAALPLKFSGFEFAVRRGAQAKGKDNAEILGEN